MSWDQVAASGQCIDYVEWNQMVTDIKDDWADLSTHIADTSVHTDGSEYKASSGIWTFVSSQKISGQLLTIRSSRDINN